MTQHPAGLIMSGSEGCLHIHIWDERFLIYPDDLGAIVFLGEIVPIIRLDSPPRDPVRIGGFVHLNRSGRAVVFEIGDVCYLVPRDRFLTVALGEEVSCLVAEIASDHTVPRVGASI